MSKTISDTLKDHIAGVVTTLCTCWRITRQDGEQFFFTDHDTDILIDGNTYEAASGALPSALEQRGNMAVDNMDIISFLDSDKITEADLTAGKFDFAIVDIFMVNYTEYEVITIT